MSEDQKPTAAAVEIITPPKQDDPVVPPQLLQYLMSPQGHEILTKIMDQHVPAFLEEIKDWRRTLLEKNISHAKHNRWMEIGIIVAAIAAIVALSFADKLNPTVAVLMGSIVGYFFGKNK